MGHYTAVQTRDQVSTQHPVDLLKPSAEGKGIGSKTPGTELTA